MPRTTPPTTLHSRISQTYSLLVVILLCFGAVTVSDLLFLQKQIRQGAVIVQFEEIILEMRREEKNLFLYQEAESQKKTLHYAEEALSQLRNYRPLFYQILNIEHYHNIEQRLQQYRQQISGWPAVDLIQLRADGHEITTFAERYTQQEREALSEATQSAQLFLLFALLLLSGAIIMVGRKLRRIAIQPLQKIERDLEQLSESSLAKIDPPSTDHEFIIFAEQFNRTLKKLQQSRDRIQQSEKLASLGNLAAGIAHELNNPLSNISTASQLVLEELEEGDIVQLRRWLSQIHDETERGRLIIRTLLDYSGKRAFHPEPVNCRKMVHQVALMMHKRVCECAAELQLNIPEDLSITVDKSRFQQVLINLIENALYAGSSTLRLSAMECERCMEMIPENAQVVGTLPPDHSRATEILLQDDGKGISRQSLKHLFEPFYTDKPPQEGTGLGLYIVQEIIREHHGCIAIQSANSGGTQVTLLLPLGPDHG